MHSLSSIFSGSDAWRHMPIQYHPLCLPPFWQRFRCLDSAVSVPSYPRSCTFHLSSVPICPTMIYRLKSPGWPCKPGWLHPPANEETLMCFASLLADNVNHSSIKVYLSAVCSLYIDHGLPDPLVNCLRLQRLLRGIKRVQGPALPRCLPITVDHLKAIQRSLDLSAKDHVMLWAVCCLGFFVFFSGWGVHSQLHV